VALIATPAIAHAEVCLSDSGIVVPVQACCRIP
jgi:hypothetical protein